ncbi:MAG: aldolase [Lachnospiraceae bacterium]|nr:aldolase [Lachnospiraceae bacterium]
MAKTEEFYRKIRSGYVIGPFMKTCDPAFVEAAGYAGMDFVILDMEHGPASVESLQNHIRAAQVAGVLPVVRVGSYGDISRVLDIGAGGVQVPQVSSAKEAEAVVREAKYFPQGERGVCRFVRAARYSALEKQEYFRRANQALVIIQLEGQKALENLDEIMEVPGIDILFIGPYDLSQSLGVPGQTTHPAVVEQMQEIVERAKKKHILVGTFTDSEKTLKRWSDAGVQYLSYSVDTGIFYEACVRVRERAKQMNAC